VRLKDTNAANKENKDQTVSKERREARQ